MSIGKKIKEIRIKRGFTQKQLGNLCGIADSNIRKYENGLQNPKIETLRKIAKALDVLVIENNNQFDLIDKNQTLIKTIDCITPDSLSAYPELDTVLSSYVTELLSTYPNFSPSSVDIIKNFFNDADLKHKAEVYNLFLHHINITIQEGKKNYDIYPLISGTLISNLPHDLQDVYDNLNDKGRIKLTEYAKDLLQIPEYRNGSNTSLNTHESLKNCICADTNNQTPNRMQHVFDIIINSQNTTKHS